MEDMNKPAAVLLREALRLPVKDKRQLVDKLVISIDADGDGTPQEELDALWATELTRRAEAAIENPNGVSAPEAMKRVKEGVAKRLAEHAAAQSKPAKRRAR